MANTGLCLTLVARGQRQSRSWIIRSGPDITSDESHGPAPASDLGDDRMSLLATWSAWQLADTVHRAHQTAVRSRLSSRGRDNTEAPGMGSASWVATIRWG